MAGERLHMSVDVFVWIAANLKTRRIYLERELGRQNYDPLHDKSNYAWRPCEALLLDYICKDRCGKSLAQLIEQYQNVLSHVTLAQHLNTSYQAARRMMHRYRDSGNELAADGVRPYIWKQSLSHIIFKGDLAKHLTINPYWLLRRDLGIGITAAAKLLRTNKQMLASVELGDRKATGYLFNDRDPVFKENYLEWWAKNKGLRGMRDRPYPKPKRKGD